MRGVRTKADVGNQIDRWDHVQPRVDQASVDKLIVPGVDTAGPDRLKYHIPEIRRFPIVKNFLEQPVLASQRQRAEAEIVLGPAAAPGCPAPDMRVSAEIVARGRLEMTPCVVRAGNHTDPRIVGESRQHRAAEIKEHRRRQTIVFDQDRRIDMFKQPRNAARHPAAATEIAVAEVGCDLARPRDVR